MYYQAELDYFMRVFEKFHLPATILTIDEMATYCPDYGLRQFLGLETDYARILLGIVYKKREATIYKITDDFRSHYLFLPLPKTTPAKWLLVGPYMTLEYTQEELLELAERYTVSPKRLMQLNSYFEQVSILWDESLLLTMVSTFAEILWGDDYHIETIDAHQEWQEVSHAIPYDEAQKESEIILDQMKIMEARYAFENELIEMVARGHTQRAELLIAKFSAHSFEQRVADPIRNLKNYGVISNTLLRKAAEKGGVHPSYLDSTSAHFARKIENFTHIKEGQKLMLEMVRNYCRLVRKHSTGQYSLMVQKTIAYIEANLSGDLHLPILAKVQNVSAGYLATLFKKETGKTIVEHINKRRMESAAELLQTSKLQVQTIAQYCGIPDVNYFSKLFKKHIGVTPKQFRGERSGALYK